MSKYGEDDTAPDLHGDDSYRAATNVVIQGKQWLLLDIIVRSNSKTKILMNVEI